MPRGESSTLELVESLMALRRTLRCVEHVGEMSGSLGFAALGVLAYIQRNEPTRATDIAKWVGVGPAALSRQVAELESAGLLERTPSPVDARAQLISLTARGLEELEQSYARRTGMLAGLLEEWDETDIAAATTTVNKIQEVLRAGSLSLGPKTPTAPKGNTHD